MSKGNRTFLELYSGVLSLLLSGSVKVSQAIINFSSKDVTLANGGTTLPSGIILKWGRGVTVANLSTVVFTTPFPTGILTAYACVSSPAKAALFDFAINTYAYNVNNLSVISQLPSPAQEFCWLAKGY